MHPEKETTTEESFGIVSLRKIDGEWHVLLIQHGRAKYWGFPKGHGEAGESPKQAAERELKEETNLEIMQYLSDSVLEEHYHFTLHGKHVAKTVRFFIAEVKGDLKLQAAEVSDARWVPLAEAEHSVTYDTNKSIVRRTLKLIKH